MAKAGVKSQDKFNFYVPSVTFEKSKNPDGTEEMKICGIASMDSDEPDADDEWLETAGFDCSPFLQSGFVNYNHINEPSAILGFPTVAEIKEDEHGKKFLYIEATLFPDSDKAKDVYKLAKILQKYPERQLGFSIEGRATERDILNKKRVKRALVTGLAVTPNPKRKNTVLNILKGDYAQAFVDYDNDLDDTEELDDEKENFTDLTIAEKNSETEKAMDTAAIAPMVRESVEGGTQPTNKKQKELPKSSGLELKKSEVIQAISTRYKGISLDNTISVYNFIEKIKEKLNHPFMNEETILKSFAVLEADKLNDIFDSIEKGQKSDSSDVPPVADKVEDDKADADADKADDKDEDTVEKSFDATEFAKSEFAANPSLTEQELTISLIRKGVDTFEEASTIAKSVSTTAEFIANNTDAIGTEDQKARTGELPKDGSIEDELEDESDELEPKEKIKKSITEEELLKSLGDVRLETQTYTKDVIKGFADVLNTRNSAFVDLVKGMNGEINSLKTSNETITKSYGEVLERNEKLSKSYEDLSKSFTQLVKQFDDLGNQAPAPKSVTSTNFKPRFETDLTKGDQPAAVTDFSPVEISDYPQKTSLSATLSDYMRKSYNSKGIEPDQLLKSSVNAFVLDNIITKPVAEIFNSLNISYK